MKKNLSVKSTGINRDELVSYMDELLDTSRYKDYSCNGLQVQGAQMINKVALMVDASLQGYRLALEKKCQLIAVHHGIIWDGIRSVSGSSYNHVKFLIENDLNLYASHLPLDLHPEIGNNAQLAAILNLTRLKPFGNYKEIDIGFEGILDKSTDLDTIVKIMSEKLDIKCTVLQFGKKTISKVAVVSGGAADFLTEAIRKGIDCYITGEPVHYNYHEALENRINVVYAGHYHTEKPGIQALGTVLQKRFGIQTEFIDLPTPI
jgi:dinuclear metal center YbgI/SA1388 family protein